MIKRKASYPVQHVESMRGGEGKVTIESLLTPAELYEKGRLYAKLTIEPGCSIGYHVHEGEMESYYILSGEALVSDNGENVTLHAGDSVWTPSGEGHSAKNTGDTPLEMIALILFK
jgi:mannose-6-phosphate isomerase-like protein (cupin superfamily)